METNPSRNLRFLGLVLVLSAAVGGLIAIQTPIAHDEEFAGTLRVAMLPIRVTDPAFISADSEIALANSVYDYLVDVDAQNNIQPRLAREWTISDDGLTYTFTLNEATFHDGSPLTARDVVWTFNRLRDPEVGSGAADLLANIESIEATGELEVTFTLKEVDPFFLFDLSDNRAIIVKEGDTDLADFNGTGPFRVTKAVGDRLEMEANHDYFIEGQPKLAKLEFIIFSDQTAAIEALRSGQVDLVWRISNAQLKSLEGVSGIRTIAIPTNGFDLVRLRTDRAPGDDPRVIRALKLATDREEIFEFVQLGLGAVGRDSPIGPLFEAYYTEETPIPPRDPQAASELLADAGYPEGLRLDLHVPNTGGRPDFAVILKEQWAEAGIDVDIILEPESIYYGENNWLEVDLGITGWGSRPTPQFYLDVMLVCGAIWNESRFCDEEFDRWARIAGTTLDEDERIRAYAEIQRILIERGPIIIPYFFAQTAAIAEQFQGFQLKAFAGRTDFRTVSRK